MRKLNLVLCLVPSVLLVCYQACGNWRIWTAASDEVWGERKEASDDEAEASVLLLTMPFSPVYSLIALAEEFDRRGVLVRIGSLASEKQKVESAGIEFINLGPALNRTKLDQTFQTITVDGVSLNTMRIVNEIFKESNSLLLHGLEKAFPLSDDPLVRQDYPRVIVYTTILEKQLLKFAEKRGILLVRNIPTIAIPPVFSPALYVPVWMSGLPLHGKTLCQRIQNFAYRLFFEIFARLWKDSLMANFLALRHTEVLTLINSFPGFDYPAHMSPMVQYTGPMLSLSRTTELADDLTDFINKDKRPVVYVSMGTVVKLQPDHVALLADALNPPTATSEFAGWKVVWALPEAQQAQLPQFFREAKGDFYVAKWIETPAMLTRGKAEVFVSHCGGHGTHESLYAGVPIVGVPFFGDQPDVCYRVEESGAGLCMRPPLLKHSSEEIKSAVRRVLTDEKFAIRASLFQQFIQTSYPGVEKAADLVELVAEWGDISFLETPVEREGVRKAANIDILMALAAMGAICCCALGCFCQRLTQRHGRGGGGPKVKEN